MPQMFQVLRCYKCSVFQVHQTKKSNKFECKMCGEKQSIKRHYGIGTGQECRKHVQRLNGIRGEMDESRNSESNYSDDDENENQNNQVPNLVTTPINVPSKWSGFVEEFENKESSINDDDDKMYLEDKEVVLELPRKRRKGLVKKINRNQNKTPCSNEKDSLSPWDENCLDANISNFVATNSQASLISKNHSIIQPIKKESSQLIYSEMPSQSCKSRWTDLNNELVDDSSNAKRIKISDAETSGKYSTKNKVIPPAVNKDSKWAKFAQEEENELEETYNEDNSQSDPNKLFSLCDDENELDNYLSI